MTRHEMGRHGRLFTRVNTRVALQAEAQYILSGLEGQCSTFCYGRTETDKFCTWTGRSPMTSSAPGDPSVREKGGHNFLHSMKKGFGIDRASWVKRLACTLITMPPLVSRLGTSRNIQVFQASTVYTCHYKAAALGSHLIKLQYNTVSSHSLHPDKRSCRSTMSNRYRNNTFVRRQGPPPGATEW